MILAIRSNPGSVMFASASVSSPRLAASFPCFSNCLGTSVSITLSTGKAFWTRRARAWCRPARVGASERAIERRNDSVAVSPRGPGVRQRTLQSPRGNSRRTDAADSRASRLVTSETIRVRIIGLWSGRATRRETVCVSTLFRSTVPKPPVGRGVRAEVERRWNRECAEARASRPLVKL